MRLIRLKLSQDKEEDQSGQSGEVLLESAVLGKRLEDFLQTDIGQFIMDRCQDDIDEMVEKLKKVSPWRRGAIVRLQAQISAMESFQNWICAAVIDGIRSAEALEDDENG